MPSKPATAAQLAKKAKIDNIWQQLQTKPTSGTDGKPKSASASLASLCRTQDSKRSGQDTLWMKQLGITNKKATKSRAAAALKAAAPAASETANDSKALAAAALTAAKEAASISGQRDYNKVSVTETRRFAGKDIQVVTQVEKGSKEAQKAAEAAKAGSSGLDAVLAEMEKKKKVNVLDKSKMDWQDLKKTDATMEEELETYKKSGDKYLDKQEFLKRAELREYELERDKRLATDIRTRGRS